MPDLALYWLTPIKGRNQQPGSPQPFRPRLLLVARGWPNSPICRALDIMLHRRLSCLVTHRSVDLATAAKGLAALTTGASLGLAAWDSLDQLLILVLGVLLLGLITIGLTVLNRFAHAWTTDRIKRVFSDRKPDT